MIIESIRDSLQAFLRRKGIKESDVASKTGIDVRTLRNFLYYGKGNLSTIKKVFDYLESLGWEYPPVTPVPIYEEVSAGDGGEIVGEEVGTILVPERLGRDSVIAIRVRGDSMYPALMDGSIIGVDTDQKELRHGKMYVLYIPWRGAIVKRVFFTEDHSTLAKSDNMEYPDIVIREEDDLFVVGRVVWSFQEY